MSPSKVYGNEGAWAKFEKARPKTALLEGPRGVGKFTGATVFAEKIASPEAIMRFQNVTVQDVREVVQWASFKSGAPRVAILEPGPCHPNVWAILKGLLEQEAQGLHIWIVGSYENPTPPGIKDRCDLFYFQMLTSQEMAAFLSDAGTMTLEPEYVTSLGNADQVFLMNRALAMKPAVANWIRAVEEGNRSELIRTTRVWEQRHTDLLIAEIASQLEGSSIVEGVTFQRVSREKLLLGLTLLHDGTSPLVTAIGTALAMMER